MVPEKGEEIFIIALVILVNYITAGDRIQFVRNVTWCTKVPLR